MDFLIYAPKIKIFIYYTVYIHYYARNSSTSAAGEVNSICGFHVSARNFSSCSFSLFLSSAFRINRMKVYCKLLRADWTESDFCEKNTYPEGGGGKGDFWSAIALRWYIRMILFLGGEGLYSLRARFLTAVSDFLREAYSVWDLKFRWIRWLVLLDIGSISSVKTPAASLKAVCSLLFSVVIWRFNRKFDPSRTNRQASKLKQRS